MRSSVVPSPGVGEPKNGQFRQRPGRYVRQEFLDWVRDTGRPDTWRFHERSQPPRDQDFVELDHFTIPDSKRTEVGMATCPICSPTAPKYFAGVLAWFPDEGVMRAIGHECAEQHFGSERANAARAARKLHTAIEGAQDFLLDTLPRISTLRAEVEELRSTAAYVDGALHQVWAASSKAACAKLAKMGAGGLLTVEKVRAVQAVDAFGKSTTKYEAEVIGAYSVVGMAFLSRKLSVSGLAAQTADALALVRTADENEALEFIVNELVTNEYLFQAERLARVATEQVERLRQAVLEARLFLSVENLASLREYTRKSGWSGPVHFDFNPTYPARFRVKGSAKKWREISVPQMLR